MNYRHAFHAGNFADVVKHIVLVRILLYLQEKPAAFRVIDTHAGAGVYDLRGAEAGKTLEWRDGIGRLLDAQIEAPAGALLAPYLDAVAALNSGRALAVYPGSPALVRALLRPQDRLIACELEPRAAAALSRELSGDARTKAVAIDGGAGCITPSVETVQDGTYSPLSRPLYVYVKADSITRPEVQEFLRFYIASLTELVPVVGYVARPTADYVADQEKLEGAIAGTTPPDSDNLGTPTA